MTNGFLLAMVASALVSGAAGAQDLAATTATPHAGFGLIAALSSRESVRSMVSDRLFRIDENVEIGARPGGVLARLEVMAGPEGWPAAAYDPSLLAAIDDWKLSLQESLQLPPEGELPGLATGPLPEWVPFKELASEFMNEAERPDPLFSFDEPLPSAFAVPAFHEVFPFARFGGGFFGSF